MTRVVPDYSDGTAPDSHRLPYYDPEGPPRTCSRVPSNAADRNSRKHRSSRNAVGRLPRGALGHCTMMNLDDVASRSFNSTLATPQLTDATNRLAVSIYPKDWVSFLVCTARSHRETRRRWRAKAMPHRSCPRPVGVVREVPSHEMRGVPKVRWCLVAQVEGPRLASAGSAGGTNHWVSRGLPSTPIS